MVEILPGSYSNPTRSAVIICFDLHHYAYAWKNSIDKSYQPLGHKSYWTAGEEPWIYIAPNELNRW